MFFDEFLSHVSGDLFRLDDAFVVAFEDDDGVFHSGDNPCASISSVPVDKHTVSKATLGVMSKVTPESASKTISSSTSTIVSVSFPLFLSKFCSVCRSRAQALPFALISPVPSARLCFFDDVVRLKDGALSSFDSIPSMTLPTAELFDFCSRLPYQGLDELYAPGADLLTYSDATGSSVTFQCPSHAGGIFSLLGWSSLFEARQLEALRLLVASSSVDLVLLRSVLAEFLLDGPFKGETCSPHVGSNSSALADSAHLTQGERAEIVKAYSLDESSYLVALDPGFALPVFRALWAFFPVVSRAFSPARDYSFLVVPSVVADLVGSLFGFKRVASLDGVSDAMLETALTLYDPRSVEFFSLQAAFDAAARIESQ